MTKKPARKPKPISAGRATQAKPPAKPAPAKDCKLSDLLIVLQSIETLLTKILFRIEALAADDGSDESKAEPKPEPQPADQRP